MIYSELATTSASDEQQGIPHTMRAVRVGVAGGGPEALAHEVISVPVPTAGQVLVKVEATTVISSEIASREGVSTAVLPLTLGNEFIGRVVSAPGGEIPFGARVAGGYGGYGYTRDGAWAEYICVEAHDAIPFTSNLDSVTLAAIPASFTAGAGSIAALGDVRGKSLLIRGGTAGVGLAIATLAADAGARVISSTRAPGKRDKLLDHGVDAVVMDGPDLAQQVHALIPGGADLAVDLLGLATLPATLKSVHEYGVVCLTGLLQDQQNSIRSGIREDRSTNIFPHPLEFIPPTVRLTVGGVHGSPRTPEMVQDWFSGFESGRYRMPIDSVFAFDDMASAHLRRADPDAFGKIVVTLSDCADASSAAQ
ncbi:zinc-binding dehydrogenase [Rhodococcus sp. JS3073]|uniref:zinc-binding dehydrogenase n=1 Tax=Rhodococcus sp. JS3073 TaxID=3002901 RepID=UPI00228667AB|nr:zinc-binding dehydrogenase [Rhodococcus sp. JS3073]WAM19762.1 zinc-binding dehydrogenase [Rhodococcus sp. JS3073]